MRCDAMTKVLAALSKRSPVFGERVRANIVSGIKLVRRSVRNLPLAKKGSGNNDSSESLQSVQLRHVWKFRSFRRLVQAEVPLRQDEGR
jgi:hypothetical protein